jgi:hypothetical protein
MQPDDDQDEVVCNYYIAEDKPEIEEGVMA